MTLNFQNKIVFPAPEASYTTDTAYGQVIYIPRNILTKPPKQHQTGQPPKRQQSAPLIKPNESEIQGKPDFNPYLQSHHPNDGNAAENFSDFDEDKKQIIFNENNKVNKLELLNSETKLQHHPPKSQRSEHEKDPFSSFQSLFSSSQTIREEEQKEIECIPCLYLPYDDGARKLIIYFHGNAEDIGLAFDLLYQFGNEMKMHVIAVEYPGYGLYKTSQPNENQIKEDAEIIFEYLTKHCGIRESDIILFGRSMGSGPSTYLASKKAAYSLLLMSPYTSIKDVSKSLLGKLSFLLTPIVYERFRNIDAIKEAKCPVFFLHGLRDRLIPHQHTLDLNNNCPTVSFLNLPENMDHNEFDFIEDLVKPFQEFIDKIDDGQKKQVPKQSNMQEEGVLPTAASENKMRKQHQPHDSEDFETHYSDIDGSCVEYIKGSDTFEVFFDKGLYEPPKIIVDNEKRLAELARQKALKK